MRNERKISKIQNEGFLKAGQWTSFYMDYLFLKHMAKKNDGGFQSQAGLVRYFDTENDKSVKLSPKLVVGIAVVFAIVILVLNVVVPMN